MTHRGPFQPVLFCDSVKPAELVIYTQKCCVRPRTVPTDCSGSWLFSSCSLQNQIKLDIWKTEKVA